MTGSVLPGEERSRYAIYFVPAPGSRLAALGSSVIGYDVDTGRDVPFVDLCGMTEADWTKVTSEPRRYGFHATLKAPFRLKHGASEDALLADVQGLAARRPAALPMKLVVKELTRFVALVPRRASPDIDGLAAEMVGQLDWLRAPLTERERERRLRAQLTERQRTYLEAYGYPYVMEEFRFHMTLAGPLPPASRSAVHQRLQALFSGPDCACTVDALTVLRQDEPDGRFRVIARYPLCRPPAAAESA